MSEMTLDNNADGSGPAPDARTLSWRALVLGAILLQAAFFGVAAYVNRGESLGGDNGLYETPAWNLASGRGYSIARSEWEDPYVTELYRAAHPEWASSPYIPATVMPPGYGYFLALVYVVAGRSQLAAILVNGALLLGTILAVAALVGRAYGRGRAAKVAMVLVASHPMWAFWAAFIMSDTLHTFLLTLFAVAWLVDRPSPRRTVAAGVLLGLASLTRPYAVLLPVAFAAAYAVYRLRTFAPRNVALLALVAWSVFGTWTVRNLYYFHKPIVVTTLPRGITLWLASCDLPHPLEEWRREREALGLTIDDFYHVREGTQLEARAIQRIRENPVRYLWACVRRVPRRWVSMDGGGILPGPAALVLGAYHVVLLAAMVAGMVSCCRTRDPVLAGCLVMVVYYSLVFFPLHVEARYMLPVRAFGLILSAPPLAALLGRSVRVLGFGGAGLGTGPRPHERRPAVPPGPDEVHLEAGYR
jgi:hypothetical protein